LELCRNSTKHLHNNLLQSSECEGSFRRVIG
jgi:hypothetical protein